MSLLYLVLSAALILQSFNNNYCTFAETDIEAVKDAAEENATDNSLYSEIEMTRLNHTTNSSNSRRPRTFHGLLGFLTGFRLAQGMGPTSYNADIRDSPQLNLLSRLFDGALYLSYIRYPQMHSFASVPTFYQPLPTHPQNPFPTGLQLPLWFPPESLSQNDNPGVNINQQFNPNPGQAIPSVGNERNKQINDTTQATTTTTKVAEEVLSTTSVKSELIEVSTVINELKIKSTANVPCNNSIECTEAVVLDERTTVPPQDEIITTTTKMIDSNNFMKPKLKDIIHPLSLRSESTETKPVNEEVKVILKNPTVRNVTMPPTSNGTQSTTTEASMQPSDTNSTTIHTSNPNTSIEYPSFYPYPYYHDYANSSDYEHVSITENPVSHDHFLKQQDYNDVPGTFDNYLPHADNEQTVPFDTSAEGGQYFGQQSNYFHPMNNPYYDSGDMFASYQQENFNKRMDTGFVPLQTFNHI